MAVVVLDQAVVSARAAVFSRVEDEALVLQWEPDVKRAAQRASAR